jgi:CheY-like chemotaxis protein
MLEEFLEELGCRFCQSVGTVQSAKLALETLVPDLVVLDLTLARGEPNFEVADILAARGIPFVFASGHTPDVLPDRHRDRPFVTKPFSPEDLEDGISMALQAAQL